MQDYAETIWSAVKKGMFPTVTGEQEKELKIAFLQGMHSGRELTLQSTTLPDREMQEFLINFKAQINGALGRVNCRPGNVSLGTIPSNNGIIDVNGKKL